MKGFNAVKQDKPTAARTRPLPGKVQNLVAKAKYEAPKVISFPFDGTKGRSEVTQITMAGNF
jgi:hypothetical protein